MSVGVSIVTYYPDYSELNSLCNVLLSSKEVHRLYIIDNSKNFDSDRFHYNKNVRVVLIFNRKNIGFGSAHNIALKKSIKSGVKYHLVLNPDIKIKAGVLDDIVAYMDKNSEIGSLMPKIVYTNGEVQRLCKLLPTPLDLFLRRFLPQMVWSQKRNKLYELVNFNYETIANIPNLSGCFMFMRVSTLKEVGLFDERYFMYLEDIDLNRRIHKVAKTTFYPCVSVVHGFRKGSYTNIRLLKNHIISAIKYFNKWGWVYDRERERMNASVLNRLNKNYNNS